MSFEIRNSYTNIGKGGFPQSLTIEMEKGKTVYDEDFIWNVSDKTFPDFTPNIGTLILRNGAKVTDFISSATISSGFIISSNVKNILEKFQLKTSKLYPCRLFHKGLAIEEYYFLQTLNNNELEIDFKKSIFNIKRFEEVIDTLVFRNLNELQEKSIELNSSNGKYKMQYESLFI